MHMFKSPFAFQLAIIGYPYIKGFSGHYGKLKQIYYLFTDEIMYKAIINKYHNIVLSHLRYYSHGFRGHPSC